MLFLKNKIRHKWSCEFCEVFKNTFFVEHIWATASKLKQPPEVFCKERCSWKIHQFYKKTSVLKSLFNKFIKKRLQHGVFLWNLKIVLEDLFCRTSVNGCFSRLQLTSFCCIFCQLPTQPTYCSSIYIANSEHLIVC